MSLYRLIQIDGSLPNMALMKISAGLKSLGHEVDFTRRAHRELFDREPGQVYASTIFRFSAQKIEAVRRDWPGAVIGGTGVDYNTTIWDALPMIDQEGPLDYSLYPEFPHSIGFTQRGCRLKCGFCVVPKKEGKNVPVASVNDIWRGEGHPKNLVLLDNDIFGQPDWERVVADLQGFKVNICQGFNVRLIDNPAASGLAALKYYDTKFKTRLLHTAWDNLGDEKIFFTGIERLNKAGIPPKHIRVYMLIGYDPKETWDRILYRHKKIIEAGMSAYPMVYDQSRKDLKRFQRWVVNRYAEFIPWEDFCKGGMYKSAKEFKNHGLNLENP